MKESNAAANALGFVRRVSAFKTKHGESQSLPSDLAEANRLQVEYVTKRDSLQARYEDLSGWSFSNADQKVNEMFSEINDLDA